MPNRAGDHAARPAGAFRPVWWISGALLLVLVAGLFA
ncbi:MAG: hypothetical protein K0Q72_2614, partial [Armatimonadetes bacterium]|nr:hypothetical protein [Armatimonadota bacterium]